MPCISGCSKILPTAGNWRRYLFLKFSLEDMLLITLNPNGTDLENMLAKFIALN
jgi:hypothetical protein